MVYGVLVLEGWGPVTFETNFKKPGSAKVERAKRRMLRDTEEKNAKAHVRRRDRGCRFPLCGCKRFGLRLEVSHSRHKGMGGNPKGDRSVPSLMMQLCDARHKTNRIALDRGTLRWVALTDAGADGPVRWELDGEAIQPFGKLSNMSVFVPSDWITVATETQPGSLAPLDEWQRKILHMLAAMAL